MAEEGFTFISAAILPVVARPSCISRAWMISIYSSIVFSLIAPLPPTEPIASFLLPEERWSA